MEKVRQKILIIDDSQPIHALVRARLSSEAVEIFSASDGESGLAMVRQVMPDLVILDVDMPDPDGFEVIRRLKADHQTDQIPVIFLTGAMSTEEKIKGLNLGAVDYITKPFDPAELRARVRSSLRTKYLMDLLARRAMIDGLTGLWNRAYFEQRIQQEISLATRQNRVLSCIMADMDHFKQINDQFGHPAGDLVLTTVASLMTEGCRTDDVICRYGGEEFVILTPGVGQKGAELLAERLRESIAGKPILIHGQPLPITCSFGVASNQEHSNSQLVAAADQALYRAKHEGRNRVCTASHGAQTDLPSSRT